MRYLRLCRQTHFSEGAGFFSVMANFLACAFMVFLISFAQIENTNEGLQTAYLV